MFLGIRSIKSFASLWSTSLSSDLFPSLESMFQWSSEICGNSLFPLHIRKSWQTPTISSEESLFYYRKFRDRYWCHGYFWSFISHYQTVYYCQYSATHGLQHAWRNQKLSSFGGMFWRSAPTPPCIISAKTLQWGCFWWDVDDRKPPDFKKRPENKAHLNNLQKWKTSQKRHNRRQFKLVVPLSFGPSLISTAVLGEPREIEEE